MTRKLALTLAAGARVAPFAASADEAVPVTAGQLIANHVSNAHQEK